MRFAITGAAGIIGHRLTAQLLDGGHEVNALVHSRNRTDVLPDEATVSVGDVRDEELIGELLEGCDGVAHLAKGGSDGGESVNIDATKTILRRAEALGCETLVFSSTVTAHPRVISDDPGSYAKTKNAASEWLRERDSDVSILTVYPTRVIGPGDYKTKRLVPYVTVVSNRLLVPPLYRFEEKNYVHVDTVTDAIAAGLFGEVSGDEMVSGETLTNRQYFQRIAEASPRRHWIPSLPGVTWWLPRLMNVGAKAGVLPSRDYTEVRWGGDPLELPDDLEQRSPVPHHGVTEAIDSAVEWYTAAGLL